MNDEDRRRSIALLVTAAAHDRSPESVELTEREAMMFADSWGIYDRRGVGSIDCHFVIEDNAPHRSIADAMRQEMRDMIWSAEVLLGHPTVNIQRENECRMRHGKPNCLCRFCISERVGLDPYRRRD